jgi:hypothetical protein
MRSRALAINLSLTAPPDNEFVETNDGSAAVMSLTKSTKIVGRRTGLPIPDNRLSVRTGGFFETAPRRLRRAVALVTQLAQE